MVLHHWHHCYECTFIDIYIQATYYDRCLICKLYNKDFYNSRIEFVTQDSTLGILSCYNVSLFFGHDHFYGRVKKCPVNVISKLPLDSMSVKQVYANMS